MHSATRLLTVVGDPNNVNSWATIPYFFLRAGQRQGFLRGGIPLDPEKLRRQRVIWNLGCLVSRLELGGFQYSESFVNALVKGVDCGTAEDEIISHFPLLPPLHKKYRSVNFYIDATLKQNFIDYQLHNRVGKRVISEALARERAQYERADRIVCMSRWAARSVVEDYAVPADKVHVIHPGANLSEEEFPEEKPGVTAAELRPLRLGFVGRDWRRKGLPFLLEVVDVLGRGGIAVELTVVGPAASSLPTHPAIRAAGFIDKAREMERFIDLIRSFHFGCLASTADASPVANLECLRLGVPVVARGVGGVADTVGNDAGFVFRPDESPEAVADRLAAFVRNPETYAQLRRRVAARAARFSWRRAVEDFIALWRGTDRFSYARLGRRGSEAGGLARAPEVRGMP